MNLDLSTLCPTSSNLYAPGGRRHSCSRHPAWASSRGTNTRRVFTAAGRETQHVSTQHAQMLNEIEWVDDKDSMHMVDALIRVLQAQGEKTVSPTGTTGLHPFLLPLTAKSEGKSEGSKELLTCLLCWPESHKGMELPVVRMGRGDSSVELVARSATEYIHRALAEDESRDSPSLGVASAVGSLANSVYEPGAVSRSGLPTLDAYLARRAGMFPDICERLATAHAAKGDSMSALITAEWYMRQGNFPNWGRPYEFVCMLLESTGRFEERRDLARVALRMPWWSLSNGFTAMRDAAELTGDADAVKQTLDMLDEMANGDGNFKPSPSIPKTRQQAQVENALHLMNRVAAGEMTWEAARSGVLEAYQAAGMTKAVRFLELSCET